MNCGGCFSFGRGGGIIHDAAEPWQFTRHTLQLALNSVYVTMPASPRSSFTPSLGRLSIEERKGETQGDWKLVQDSQTGRLLVNLLKMVSL